jgi:hypothetical protein
MTEFSSSDFKNNPKKVNDIKNTKTNNNQNNKIPRKNNEKDIEEVLVDSEINVDNVDNNNDDDIVGDDENRIDVKVEDEDKHIVSEPLKQKKITEDKKKDIIKTQPKKQVNIPTSLVSSMDQGLNDSMEAAALKKYNAILRKENKGNVN